MEVFVSNRKYQEIENQLEELTNLNKEKFNQLIKNSFDMIVLIDAEGKQQYVSPSCERILGYKPSELIGIPVIEEMIHPDDREKTMAGLADIITNSTNGGAQYRHRHKNGQWVYLEAFGTNQLNNPSIKSVVLNVRDITERKKIEQDLKEMNATKDRFISIIGHDLKNPFNSIIGFSDLLLEEIRTKNLENIEEYATIIHDSSIRVNDLLTNLLTWSRAQSGKIKFRPSEFDLRLLIQEIKQLFKDSLLQKSIQVAVNIPSPFPLFADKDMIDAVIRNLVSNGIKFTGKGGEIKINAENNINHIIVSVSDNGIGLNEKRLGKLFCIESSHSTKGTQGEKGTGLGLLLCKEFIDLHEGEIWVEQNENAGSTFKFSIPRS